MNKIRNEKQTRKGLSSNIQSHTNNGEYDLKSNFRKIRLYTQKSRKKCLSHGITDSSEDFSRKKYQEYYVNSSDSIPLQTSSGNSLWNSYCRLDDKISDYKDKNETAHTDLRRELEQKINTSEDKQNERIENLENKIAKKLSKQWYCWTIAGILAMVGIWFTFSYREVSQVPKHIQSIENKIDFMEKSIHKNDNHLDSLHRKL